MRWPLKNQILLRMLCLLLATIAAMTGANIQSALSVNRQRQSQRLMRIEQLLSSFRFPLTSSVLDSMAALSGAEFQTTDESEKVISRTPGAPLLPARFRANPHRAAETSINSDRRQFVHSVVPIPVENSTRTPGVSQIHIYLPRESAWVVWWQAGRAPLLIAAIILPVALLISLALANNVTQPLARLKEQVHQIASGNIQEIQPNRRNDEVRDLNLSINEMALKLRDHDQQLRRNERLQALLQFGNGLAHNLRNSATGCTMAIELLAKENSQVASSENIDVARRQLRLMENYIQKFMGLAHSHNEFPEAEVTEVDLIEVLGKVVFLLKPSASHLNVALVTRVEGDCARIDMLQDDAEQLLINLISNAIAAASEKAAAAEGDQAIVRVTIDALDSTRLMLTVADSGAGPPAEIAGDLFQPFVTGKPEGTGLGLSLVQDIADRLGGSIRWSRDNGETRFVFRFFSDVD